MTIIENPPKQGLAFKFFVIACIIFLFILIIYIMFGPLPSQSKFIKKSGGSNSLNVNGDSVLNGDVVIGGYTLMNENARIAQSLAVPEVDLITSASGTDTIQGSISAKLGGTTQIKGNTNVIISDSSGTNTIAKFTGSNKQTDLYGDVVINDMDGSTSLILKNQSPSLPSYELLNNSSGNDDLVIRSKDGTTVKNIIDANSIGDTMTLLDSSSSDPKLYVNGTSGLGRVYDDEYNIPPSSSGNFPNINVSGTSTLTTVNVSGNLTVSQVLNTVSAYPSKIATTEIYDWRDTATLAGRISADKDESYNVYIQGKNNIQFATNGSPDQIASFDVSTPFSTRSNFVVPAFDLKGFMKYTLPSYGTLASVQTNSYSYQNSDSTSLTYSGTIGWPGNGGSGFSSVVRNWTTTEGIGSSSLLVTSGSLSSYAWRCPKRGIWLVEFDSKCDGISNNAASYGIGSTTTGVCYGVNKVSTFVVINLDELIIVALNYASAATSLSSKNATMSFKLVMELNPATII